MPLPASLIASIVSAVLETASQSSSTTTAQQYDIYTATRTLPPEAKLGLMLPPPGDGSININGTKMQLAPTAQFRSQRNMIVMPMTIQKSSDVVYLTDTFGAVNRVWMLSQAEVSAIPKN